MHLEGELKLLNSSSMTSQRSKQLFLPLNALSHHLISSFAFPPENFLTVQTFLSYLIVDVPWPFLFKISIYYFSSLFLRHDLALFWCILLPCKCQHILPHSTFHLENCISPLNVTPTQKPSMLLLPLHTLHCLSNVALTRFQLITHPFTHLFVYTSVHPFINLPIHPPIYISMHTPIYSLTFQPIHLSTHRAIHYPLIYLSAHPPTNSYALAASIGQVRVLYKFSSIFLDFMDFLRHFCASSEQHCVCKGGDKRQRLEHTKLMNFTGSNWTTSV